MCAPPPGDPLFACRAGRAFVPGVPGDYMQFHVFRTETAAGAFHCRRAEMMCVRVTDAHGVDVQICPGLVHYELAPAVEAR